MLLILSLIHIPLLQAVKSAQASNGSTILRIGPGCDSSVFPFVQICFLSDLFMLYPIERHQKNMAN